MSAETPPNVAVLLALAGGACLLGCWERAVQPAAGRSATAVTPGAAARTADVNSEASGKSLVLTISPARVILTGVRGVAPAANIEVTLHNAGASALKLTEIALLGDDSGLFQIQNVPERPVTIAAGAELALTVELLT